VATLRRGQLDGGLLSRVAGVAYTRPVSETGASFAYWRGSRLRQGLLEGRRGVIAALTCWFLFLALFGVFDPSGDGYGLVFLENLVGDHHDPHVKAYQFGLAFFEAPFYLLGKLLVAIGVPSTIGGYGFATGSIAVGMALVVVLICALLLPLFERLGLSHSTFALFACVFGSPLVYYGSFQTGQSHVVDTLLFTTLVVLVFRYFREDRPSPRLALVMGVVLGVSMSVRYFSGAEAPALLAGLLLLRRRKDAALVAVTAPVTLGLLALVPIADGVGHFWGDEKERPGRFLSHLYPLNPLRMLFSDHRGLFLWTPVVFLGVIGFVRLIRTRSAERWPLVIVAGMALGVVLAYAFVPFWDGGWAFSQRYFTSFFPIGALGLASLLEWRPSLVKALATAGILWSLLIVAFVGFRFGYDPARGGATTFPRRLVQGQYSPGLIGYNVYWNSRLHVLLPGLYHH
jgi:hypothetical protein